MADDREATHMAMWICSGLCIGVGLGVAFDDLALFIALGLSFGLLGYGLAAATRRRRP